MTHVHLLAWGRTEADIDRAVRRAKRGLRRAVWDLHVVRLRTLACPLQLGDPAALAVEVGKHGTWAYAAYEAQGAS